METLFDSSNAETFIEIPESSSEVSTWHPTGSQKQVLSRLHQLAEVFFRLGDAMIAGLRPACRLPLVIGASGSGKSAVVGQFAKQRKLGLLALDCGSWIVAGAAAKPATLRIVRDYVRAHEQGVLFCDEVCKLLPQGEGLLNSGWALSVFAEAISLFSASESLAVHDWSVADIAKLRNNFLCVGGGAFQAALSDVRQASNKGGLGFSGAKAASSHKEEITRHLPEEVLSRFSEIIVLDPPSREDFQETVQRIHSDLGIKRQRPMKELLDEALNAAGGMRWAEKYVCSLLIEHPYCVRQRYTTPSEKAPVAKAVTIDLMAGDVAKCLTLTNETAASLRVKLGRIYSRLHQWLDQGTQMEQPLGRFNQPELGEALVSALRSSQAMTQLRGDENEEMAALSNWRTLAWQVGCESATILAKLELTEIWMEAWSLTSNLIDYRLALRRAVEKGMSS